MLLYGTGIAKDVEQALHEALTSLQQSADANAVELTSVDHQVTLLTEDRMIRASTASKLVGRGRDEFVEDEYVFVTAVGVGVPPYAEPIGP